MKRLLSVVIAAGCAGTGANAGGGDDGKDDGTGSCPEPATTASGYSAWDALNFGCQYDDMVRAQQGLAAIQAVGQPACFAKWAPALWNCVRSDLGPQLVEPLVAAGLDPNITDFVTNPLCAGCTGVLYGYGALHYATLSPNETHDYPTHGVKDFAVRVSIVDHILAAGGAPNLVSAGSLYDGGNQVGAAPIGGATPLMYVAKWQDAGGASQATASLLAAGADPNIRCLHGAGESIYGEISPGEIPLTVARRSNNSDAAQQLLAAGARDYDLAAEDQAGRATSSDVIQTILATKVVGQDRIWSVWSEYGSAGIATMLASGLDPNARLWGDKLVPYMATLYDTLVVRHAPLADFQALVTAGGDLNAPGASGLTPVLEVIDQYDYLNLPDHRAQIVAYLLQAGAAVDGRAPDGDTPLLRAFYTQGQLDLLSVLLDAGADPNAQNNAGERPLTLAVKATSPQPVISALLAKSIDFSADVMGLPLWAYVARHNPQYASTAKIQATIDALTQIANDPRLVVDLTAPGVSAALDDAATNANLAPIVQLLRSRG